MKYISITTIFCLLINYNLSAQNINPTSKAGIENSAEFQFTRDKNENEALRKKIEEIVKPVVDRLQKTLQADPSSFKAYLQEIKDLQNVKSDEEKLSRVEMLKKKYYPFIKKAWDEAHIDEEEYKRKIKEVFPTKLRETIVFGEFLTFQSERKSTKSSLTIRDQEIRNQGVGSKVNTIITNTNPTSTTYEKPDTGTNNYEETPCITCKNGSDIIAANTLKTTNQFGTAAGNYYIRNTSGTYTVADAYPVQGYAFRGFGLVADVTPKTYCLNKWPYYYNQQTKHGYRTNFTVTKKYNWHANAYAISGLGLAYAEIAHSANFANIIDDGDTFITIWAPAIFVNTITKNQTINYTKTGDDYETAIYKFGMMTGSGAYANLFAGAHAVSYTDPVSTWTICIGRRDLR